MASEPMWCLQLLWGLTGATAAFRATVAARLLTIFQVCIRLHHLPCAAPLKSTEALPKRQFAPTNPYLGIHGGGPMGSHGCALWTHGTCVATGPLVTEGPLGATAPCALGEPWAHPGDSWGPLGTRIDLFRSRARVLRNCSRNQPCSLFETVQKAFETRNGPYTVFATLLETVFRNQTTRNFETATGDHGVKRAC